MVGVVLTSIQATSEAWNASGQVHFTDETNLFLKFHFFICFCNSRSSCAIHKMNQYILYTLLTFLDLCTFCLILLSRKSSAADFQYEACRPKTCGRGPNISYPFYIQALQESYCGYPGFGISCNIYGYPIIKLSEQAFIVKDIFYTVRSFRVSYAAVSSVYSNNSCLPQIGDTTLPDMFDYVKTRKLYLLSNCAKTLSQDLAPYNVTICEGESRENWGLAILEGDKNLEDGFLKCQKTVIAPAEVQGNGVGGDYLEVLRRGFLLNWTASDCTACADSGGHCGFNTSIYQFKCFCREAPHSFRCPTEEIALKSPSKGRSYLKLISIASVAVIIFPMIIFILWRKNMLNFKVKTQMQKDIELFLKNNENLAPRRYHYSDLKKMTNSFSDNLGEGGFAKVYKGELPDGRLVAVKILKELKGNGEEFMNEVASISRTSHINIVALIGFCFEGSKRALICEFMPNGSLEKFIYSNSFKAENQLGSEKLFQVALGVARGIEYLHQGCNTRILHFDIKPHNILLDKDFNPKISDFGLAKLCPNRSSVVSMLGARGTIGYIAPEIVCRNLGKVSHKSDVYSYGMVVLDMVGQRKNVDVRADHSSEIYFPHWIYKRLEQEAELDLNQVIDEDEHLKIKKMVIVGLWCIQTDPTIRPSMSRVVEMLEGDMESLQIPPKPYFSSPPRAEANSSTSESAVS